MLRLVNYLQSESLCDGGRIERFEDKLCLQKDLPLLEGLYNTDDFLYKCDILYKLFTCTVLNQDSLFKIIQNFLIFSLTFTFMHLADAFIQSDLQLHSGYTFSVVHVFPGN